MVSNISTKASKGTTFNAQLVILWCKLGADLIFLFISSWICFKKSEKKEMLVGEKLFLFNR